MKDGIGNGGADAAFDHSEKRLKSSDGGRWAVVCCSGGIWDVSCAPALGPKAERRILPEPRNCVPFVSKFQRDHESCPADQRGKGRCGYIYVLPTPRPPKRLDNLELRVEIPGLTFFCQSAYLPTGKDVYALSSRT